MEDQASQALGSAIIITYLLFVVAFNALPVILAAMRKTGKAGICFLLLFIPFIGWFISLYKALTDEGEKQRVERLASEDTAKHVEELRHQQLLAAVSNK
jgi:hypothetical protein